MRFGVLYNSRKDPEGTCAEGVKKLIAGKGQDVVFTADIYDHAGCTDCACDFLYVMGGDGTILSAARSFSDKSIPIVGVNMGRLGYLSEIDVNDIEYSIDCLLSGRYSIDERIMLSCSSDGENAEFLALNDFVVSHAKVSRIVDIEISINGHAIDHYLCDGMIVSTPTGSTAYSLSSGGPVISPDTPCLLITPICPHTLSSKSIIISDGDEVGLRLLSDINTAVVSGDGIECFGISHGMSCTVRRSEKTARFIRFRERNFFDILKIKLNTDSEKDRDKGYED